MSHTVSFKQKSGIGVTLNVTRPRASVKKNVQDWVAEEHEALYAAAPSPSLHPGNVFASNTRMGIVIEIIFG